MNFSEVVRVGRPGLSWSPDGRLAACPAAAAARLEVRDATSLQVVLSFTCIDVIQAVEWAPDSCRVLTASHKRGVVQVWSVEDPQWRCKISEGAAGLVRVCWAPDSRHLLTTAEFYLRITVWSLVNKTVSYIKHPKNTPHGLQFSPDSEYLVVAERRSCKDHLSLFETKSWQLVKHFEVGTVDLAGVQWSSSESVLAVWDSPLHYKVLMYSLSGHCLASYSAYQWSLGVRTVAWSPSGQFLAVGSYDNKVRLLNHMTWRVMAEFSHAATVSSPHCVVYREVEAPLTGYPATLAAARGLPLVADTYYQEEESRPVVLATVAVEPGKQGVARLGISSVAFSRDGRYLATRREDMPATVWIWGVPKLSLRAVLVHTNAVKDLAWDPGHPRLAVVTGTCHVYFWSPFGCVTVAVPDAPLLQVTSLRWHPSGNSLALQGRDSLSVCFLDPPGPRPAPGQPDQGRKTATKS